ncbi:sugar transferase [Bacteroides ovatus]|uniref:Sugar transferase n=1 Tax=Bacteroides ovatus TaxID=28116 RepID=A0A1G8BYF1_BACOV|nr:sugar transferase [Bacteroides ovatus]SDH38053.1 sugar transferase [Bacteroides ovatus]
MNKFNREQIVIIIFDLLLALFCFWIVRYFVDLPRWYWLVLSAVIWVAIGVVSGKLKFREYKRIRYAYSGIILIGLLSCFFIYKTYKLFVPGYEYDNSIIYASGVIIIMECLLYLSIRNIVFKKIPYFYEPPVITDSEERKHIKNDFDVAACEIDNDIQNLISTVECDTSDDEMLELFASKNKSSNIILLDSTNPESILSHKTKLPKIVLASRTLNDIEHCNTFFSYINYSLADNGYLVCQCETTSIRKERMCKSTPIGIRQIFLFFDYIFNRVFPKLTITKGIYFKITQGKRRVLNRVEVLGKLYRAGFEVIYENITRGRLYVIAQKVKEPIRDSKPNTGPFIRLQRIGKDGKEFGVYKLRTMYSYSEYIQPYIYKQLGLAKGGKISDDYRVSPLGRFLRKTWLDELPMLINWIKGEMKFVGVRPLSNHYFSLYSKELQELRTKVKPGLFPPFYADLPETLEEIQESEIRYIKSYLKRPFYTDCRYFFKTFVNIAFKGKRSK